MLGRETVHFWTTGGKQGGSIQQDDSLKEDLTFDSGLRHAPGANWCWQLFGGWGREKTETDDRGKS
jgi:hypothetical protein